MYTWGSGRFCGVGRDAEYLAQRIIQYTNSARPMPGSQREHARERERERSGQLKGLRTAA